MERAKGERAKGERAKAERAKGEQAKAERGGDEAGGRSDETGWRRGQEVRAVGEGGIVPAGTLGVIRRVYADTETLIVLFEGAPGLYLVGVEEVEQTGHDSERERAVGEPPRA